jgi:hypothetical protein
MTQRSILVSLCGLVLLALVGPAFAQAPPFTMSFTQAQYSAQENNFPLVYVTTTGTIPLNTPFQVSVTEMPSGHVQTYNLTWFSDGPRAISTGQDDLYYNPGRSFVAKILSVGNGGAIVAPSTATMTIIDNEAPPKVSINDVTIVEGTNDPGLPTTSYAVFTVSLASALTQSMSVSLIVHDQSAKNGVDYQWVNQSAFFSAGAQSTSVWIPIISDNLPEGDETFTVEALPQSPIIAGKTIGICTILDDDGAVSPQLQRIAQGEKGVIHIQLGNPAAASEQVILQASDPTLLAVPSFVAIAAGTSAADAEFIGLKPGAGSIYATLPPSRGGRRYELSVTVHDGTAVTVDPIQLNLSLGTSGAVTARVNPVPAAPVRLVLQPEKSGIVSIADTILTGADGRAVIPVRATGLGSTDVSPRASRRRSAARRVVRPYSSTATTLATIARSQSVESRHLSRARSLAELRSFS